MPEKTRSKLSILEVSLSLSEEIINFKDDNKVESYNRNIESQHLRMKQMKEVMIEGLPKRATLDDEFRMGNKTYMLGELIMDSAEGKKQDNESTAHIAA